MRAVSGAFLPQWMAAHAVARHACVQRNNTASCETSRVISSTAISMYTAHLMRHRGVLGTYIHFVLQSLPVARKDCTDLRSRHLYLSWSVISCYIFNTVTALFLNWPRPTGACSKLSWERVYNCSNL